MKKLEDLTKDEYETLKATGMFYELYPDATGVFNYDTLVPCELNKPMNPPKFKVTKEDPKVGEVWWVSIDGSISLTRQEVTGISEKVVGLYSIGYTPSTASFYKRGSVEFVEKIDCKKVEP